MEISSKTLDAFRADFEETVKALEEKYEVSIQLGRITYNDNSFRAKIEVRNGRDEYETDSAAFDEHVWKYEHLGLSEGMYNRVFIGKDGKMYALRGFNTRASKYPLQITDIRTGERLTAGEGFIKEMKDEYYVENLTEE